MKNKKIIKIIKSLKDLIVKHEFLSWTFASIIFAFIIHCLFSKEAPTQWLSAEWTAGEILTYTSTVALGLLALWQNKRFKKANDESQKRMEELTKYANELSLKSQIIDAEAKRIVSLKNALNDFINYCNPTHICSEYSKLKNDDVIGGTYISDVNTNAILKYKIMIAELERDKSVVNVPLQLSAYFYLNSFIDYIDYISSNPNYDSSVPDKQVTSVRNILVSFINEKDEYIINVEKMYNKLVYTDMSLDKIYSIFSINNHTEIRKA